MLAIIVRLCMNAIVLKVVLVLFCYLYYKNEGRMLGGVGIFLYFLLIGCGFCIAFMVFAMQGYAKTHPMQSVLGSLSYGGYLGLAAIVIDFKLYKTALRLLRRIPILTSLASRFNIES